ncbi:MAG: 3-hydroxybutyryl-CoA dehydrogenase [Deltaproteobacteria bacterium]|nr:3-hydroxybutyryl-CoA dehydrogenase [Deltaproteobacteria bacterium]MBI4412595.1 3-hydroxybutyryl-CoA dehydrogenase [Deltaproteobacteria bacterium]
MNITKIGIVGAGVIGAGIAETAARQGLGVILVETTKVQLEKAVETIRRGLKKAIGRKEVAEKDEDLIIGRVQLALDIQALTKIDFVIEAVTEDERTKTDLFSKLHTVCPAPAIFASATSSLSITKLAKASKRAPQVIGMHFMNPVPVMKLVEIVRGVQTAPETIQAAKSVAERMGKETVLAHDFPGFMVNRVIAPMINEAIYSLYEGVGSAQDIDRALKLGANHPMGPLQLADLLGLDAVLNSLEMLHRQFGNPKFSPCPLLVKYVEAGFLGRKTGKGFYEY